MKAALAALLFAVPAAALAQAPAPYGYPPPPPPSGYPPPPPSYRYQPPPPPARPPPRQVYYGPPPRAPWYLGFGIGWGDGSAYGQGGATSSLHDWMTPSGYSDDGRLGLAVRAGASLTPQLALGFDLSSLRAFGSAPGGLDADVAITNYDAVLTLFPMGRGFFVRGGMGASTLTSPSHVSGVPSSNVTHSGFNLLGGVGYAFWLGGPANLSINFDASRQFFSGPDVSGSSFFLTYLGVDFY